MHPQPRHVVEKCGDQWTDPANIVTNGPFRLQDWVAGESVSVYRNPTYHGRFGGNVQRLQISRLCGEASEADVLAQYAAGAMDILSLNGLSPAEESRARQRHAGEVVSTLSLGTRYLGFNCGRSPFDDQQVRRAFALAIDRERLAAEAVGGTARAATGGFVPPGMPGHSPGIALPYDPAEARRLLSEAGYPAGRGFPSVQALAGSGVAVPAYLRAQWKEALGVDIAWEQMEWAAYLARLSSQLPDLWWIGWSADYPDPEIFLGTGHYSYGSYLRTWMRSMESHGAQTKV